MLSLFMSVGEQDINGNLLWMFLISYSPEDGNNKNSRTSFNKLRMVYKVQEKVVLNNVSHHHQTALNLICLSGVKLISLQVG